MILHIPLILDATFGVGGLGLGIDELKKVIECGRDANCKWQLEEIARNCEWNEWQSGSCSETCGEGTRTNTRTKKVTESNGGTCEGDLDQQETCNVQECPSKLFLKIL